MDEPIKSYKKITKFQLFNALASNDGILDIGHESCGVRIYFRIYGITREDGSGSSFNVNVCMPSAGSERFDIYVRTID